ncbi:ribbon-helix-helix domain-containing protein [Thalassospiraceae bacterium LMO-JJ14]|nr:ribbon-helix-helix domain-containing protein [Thalassospiraceae bacterium LMO-JJ14]
MEDTGGDPTIIKKRSVSIAGHATSISLEDAFWTRLGTIAKRRGQSLSALIRDVDEARTGNLSSALRVFVLENSAPE